MSKRIRQTGSDGNEQRKQIATVKGGGRRGRDGERSKEWKKRSEEGGGRNGSRAEREVRGEHYEERT